MIQRVPIRMTIKGIGAMVKPTYLIGGGYAAVKLMKAASDGGLELKTNKDGKGNLNLSLKGHYDMKDTGKVPMEFYVKEAE